MKKNTITIEVKGATGSGKTEVCELIHNALTAYYGKNVEVVAPQLDLDRKASHLGILDDAKYTGQSCLMMDSIITLVETVVEQQGLKPLMAMDWHLGDGVQLDKTDSSPTGLTFS